MPWLVIGRLLFVFGCSWNAKDAWIWGVVLRWRSVMLEYLLEDCYTCSDNVGSSWNTQSIN